MIVMYVGSLSWNSMQERCLLFLTLANEKCLHVSHSKFHAIRRVIVPIVHLSPRPTRSCPRGCPWECRGCPKGCPWQPPGRPSSPKGSPWWCVGVRHCRLWRHEHKQRGRKFVKQGWHQHFAITCHQILPEHPTLYSVLARGAVADTASRYLPWLKLGKLAMFQLLGPPLEQKVQFFGYFHVISWPMWITFVARGATLWPKQGYLIGS